MWKKKRRSRFFMVYLPCVAIHLVTSDLIEPQEHYHNLTKDSAIPSCATLIVAAFQRIVKLSSIFSLEGRASRREGKGRYRVRVRGRSLF